MEKAISYYEWLIGSIDGGRANAYEDLLHHLFETAFVWSVHKDENRAADGIELRYQFADEIIPFEVDDPTELGPDYCSVLEMMVALSHRMEDILYDPNFGDQTAKWFWMIVDNLEMSWMDYGNFDERFYAGKIDFVLERAYGRNGVGGFFFTKDPSLDFRNMEIWYQMMHFIHENF